MQILSLLTDYFEMAIDIFSPQNKLESNQCCRLFLMVLEVLCYSLHS